jgi:type III pantothenate kinase
VGQSGNFLDELKNRFSDVTILTAQTAAPFTNAYSTPHTLGIDRMVLAVGAVQLFPKQAALIIDCGSCITYDWLNEEGVYYGGAISPGLGMRYEALHQFTARLPLLSPKIPNDFPGNSTADSIHLGVVQSTVYEIEGFIQAQQAKHANFILILTGGDAEFLAEQLKSPIFVRPTFQLEGLCAWYQYLHS